MRGFSRLVPFFLFSAACGEAADALYAERLVISELDPLSGPSDGGTLVWIRGVAICDDLAVRFGGELAPRVEVVSRELAFAEAPPHVIGSVDVELSCPKDQLTFPEKFGYAASKVILV